MAKPTAGPGAPSERSRAAHLGPARRRPQILDAALAIASERGLGAVTIGAIAERLDVTRPVVYAVFRNRVDLVGALVDREAERLATSARDALYAGRADTPEEAFRLGFRALLHTVEANPASWRFLLAGAPDPATVDLLRAGRAAMAEQATAWIGPAMAHWWSVEDLDRKLPVLIELFISSCEAAGRSLLDPAGDWSPDELGDLYARMILAAFAAA